jgi:uncharacterized Zn-finger protein
MLRAARVAVSKAAAATTIPARSFTLYYHPHPHGTHCADLIAKYKQFKHTGPLPTNPYKTALEYIEEVPVIEVDGNVAICDGDDADGLGHPREYIQLNKVKVGEPAVCKYCSLKYVMKQHH